MIRRKAATVASALAALSALATVGACTSTDATPNTGDTTAQSSDPTTAPPTDEPIDLSEIPQGTSLEPGTYAVGLLDDDGPTLAIVDVPVGYYSSFGGTVVGSGAGDIAFWGKVTRVDSDPCFGGKRVAAGTSVDDLVSLLIAQRHMKISQPVPVTIGGYHGVYLELTAPADLDRCRGGIVTILSAGDGWLSSDVPSATFDEWILDVEGQRVVGGARIDADAANRAELIDMVESARFSVTG